MGNPMVISDSILSKTDWFHWKEFVSKHEIICFRKSRERNQGCENNFYESPSYEENDSDSENTGDGRAPRVTVNNLHLTININIEAAEADQKKNSKQLVLTEENSSKLLNIVDNVLTQNCKS